MFRIPKKKKNVFMGHISTSVKKLKASNREISTEEYKKQLLNSYERKYLIPNLSDDAFIYDLEQCIKQVPGLTENQLPETYDHYLKTDGIRELLKRFKYQNDYIKFMHNSLMCDDIEKE